MDNNLIYQTTTKYSSISGEIMTVISIYKNRIEFWGSLIDGSFFNNYKKHNMLYRNVKNVRLVELNQTLIGMLIPFFAPKKESWLVIESFDGNTYATVKMGEQEEIRLAYNTVLNLV